MPTTFEIHPAIGIARVGSSQEFLFGPEPGLPIDPNRRDGTASKLLKRQAVRFRVYSCTRDANGTITTFEEITPAKATITWTVHLVNRKAAAPKFLKSGTINIDPTFRRNGASGNDTTDASLIIDGGVQSLTGTSQPKKAFQGKFQGHDIPLGEMTTDTDGRLVVVGGFGKSQTFAIGGHPIGGEFADNDTWHDDTSDGPVSVTLHFTDGSPDVTVENPAWVISCQPDFAPGIGNIVTLYDAMIDQAIRRGVRPTPTFKPAFDRDVLPLLKRALGYQWVNKFNRVAHGPGGPGDFTDPDLGDPLASNAARQAVFKLLRDPDGPVAAPPVRAMPALLADDYFDDHVDFAHKRVQSLTRQQYRILKEWAAGSFDATAAAPHPVEKLPDLLTRTTLEACVGASFCPGIEAGRKTRDASIYMAGESFRFDHSKLKPGGLTESMALPWQADFSLCRWEAGTPPPGPNKGRGWWPAQRPDHVVLKPGDGAAAMEDWEKGASNPDTLVANWDKLGVVLEVHDPVAGTVYIETQRMLPR